MNPLANIAKIVFMYTNPGKMKIGFEYLSNFNSVWLFQMLI